MRAILTYHSIDPSGSPISIDRDAFAKHVDFLASSKVDVVDVEELLARTGERTDERDALAVTFDDGFVNFAAEAWPLLRAARIPTTLFVPSQRVGSDNRWEGRDEPGIPTAPLLGWDELRSLVGEGLTIGSHSRTHAHLDRLDGAEIEREVSQSALEIESELALRPRVFCYPYGDHDDRTVACVAKHYACACTTRFDVLGAAEGPFRLPRLDAYYYRGAGRLEAFGTAAFRSHLWVRQQARRVGTWIRR